MRVLCVLAALLSACSTTDPPVLAPIEDQVVAVGGELRVTLSASTSDGHHVDYHFNSNMPEADRRAQLSQRPDGTGLFILRPLAADVGSWQFDFSASDGRSRDTLTVTIEVKPAVGAATKPLFRSPLGQGTMLDLAAQHCVTLDVLVEDSDSTSVTIAEEDPKIEGAMLLKKGEKAASWKWCPSDAQKAASDRYLLRLSADDGDNPKTVINYAIVLRRPPDAGCSGEAPAISHTPADAETIVGIDIVADVSDDKGLKRAPLLYYGSSDPGASPDLATLTQEGGWKQVDMTLAGGTATSGTYHGQIPNPVADKGIGDSAGIWYVITASDNDDPTGTCNHFTQSPVYHMTVTNPGGQGQLGVCQECTHDVQCGGADDNCIRIGPSGDGYCAKACAGNGDCPSGYSCSDAPVSSVNGASARQCIPDAGTCTAAVPTCADDAREENDTPDEAILQPALAAGTYDLVSCPSYASFADEDWYRIELTERSKVQLALEGSLASDIDMALFNDSGEVVGQSTNYDSDEGIVAVLPAGTYLLGVGAQPILGATSVERNPYRLSYTVGPASTCTDDGFEPDDDIAHARPQPALWGFPQRDNQICSGNDDYFKVQVAEGETLLVDLTFTQSAPTENLDLHLLDQDGYDLTPCSEAYPETCSAFQGQSDDSNEHLEYTVSSADACAPLCTFYVVVHGWSGSENHYDLTLDVIDY